MCLLEAPRGTQATVDFASAQPVAIGEIVRAMAAVAGSDIAIEYDGTTAEYIEFRSGDRTMAETFGVVPRISFEDGFRRLQAFVATHEDAAVRG
jgi:nucleoside-diphosphate-sugar epimerase